jgi:TetR/AcrR family transcriptional repressor of lmrAB and yxaGH operons
MSPSGSAEGKQRTQQRTKQRMLASAVQLLRERGAAGVTVDAVLAHSAAPRGSVYHHFPGGRDELILGAVRAAGDFIGALVDETPADGDPRRELERFVRFWQQALADDDFRAGCPVVALVVDSRLDSPEATRLVREIFTRWRATLERLLHADGVPTERAGRLATLLVAAVEGAVILCRAYRDPGPLDDVLAEIAPLLDPP